MLQVHPIAAVEIEVSPWSYEEETKNGTPSGISPAGSGVTYLSVSHCDCRRARYCCYRVLVRVTVLAHASSDLTYNHV